MKMGVPRILISSLNRVCSFTFSYITMYISFKLTIQNYKRLARVIFCTAATVTKFAFGGLCGAYLCQSSLHLIVVVWAITKYTFAMICDTYKIHTAVVR